MRRIGEILIEECGLSSSAVERALQAQEESENLVGEILIKNGEIDELVVLYALGLQFGIEVKKSLPSDIQTGFTERVPISYLKQHKIVPIITADDKYFAINNPLSFQPLDDLRKILDMETCRPVLSPGQHIFNAINFAFDMTQTSADEVMQDIDEEDPERLFLEIEEIGDLLDDTSDSPVIRLVNLMFSQAVRDNASDIHIEPYQNSLKIRQRLDGILHDMLSPPKHVQSALVSRVKIM